MAMIKTAYIRATSRRKSVQIWATCLDVTCETVKVDYDDSLSVLDNHKVAARLLAARNNLQGMWVWCGHDGKGCALFSNVHTEMFTLQERGSKLFAYDPRDSRGAVPVSSL